MVVWFAACTLLIHLWVFLDFIRGLLFKIMDASDIAGPEDPRGALKERYSQSNIEKNTNLVLCNSAYLGNITFAYWRGESSSCPSRET